MARDVPAKNGPHQIEWEDNKKTYPSNSQLQKIAILRCTSRGQCYHSEDGDGSRGMVVDGNKVDEEGSSTDEGGEERCSTHHLFDPGLP